MSRDRTGVLGTLAHLGLLRLAAVAAAIGMVVLVAAGCSDLVTSDPKPVAQTAETTAPTRAPEPLRIEVHTRPADCEMPLLVIDREFEGSLAAGEATSPVQGLVLRSEQDSPDGAVDLRVTRRIKGCVGHAHLTGGGDQDVHVLGVNLHIFWPTASSTGVGLTGFHIAAR